MPTSKKQDSSDLTCIGVAEWHDIGPGVEATDAMLKEANVRLRSAFTLTPGRWFALISGELSEVKSAILRARSFNPTAILDTLIIPNLDPAVARALSDVEQIGKREAAGILECRTLVAGISAADLAVKAADVALLQIKLYGGMGGKSLVIIAGMAAEVKEAVAVAQKDMQTRNATISAIVIPQVHDKLREFLTNDRM
jgi:bacterial microcompartment shell protein